MERKTVIIHGIKIGDLSPRAGREHCELWGVTRCNAKYWKGELRDWTRWFDLHPLENSGEWTGIEARRPEAWKWYQEQAAGRPIYLQHAHPRVRASVSFPLADVQAAFPVLDDLSVGPDLNRMFTCMVDYIFALALMEGFERIILNGIGMNASVEHQYLHRGILYWIGFARGRGVEVLVEGSSTYRQPDTIYGYERFGYDELRRIRRSISVAGQRARRRGRPMPKEDKW